MYYHVHNEITVGRKNLEEEDRMLPLLVGFAAGDVDAAAAAGCTGDCTGDE